VEEVLHSFVSAGMRRLGLVEAVRIAFVAVPGRIGRVVEVGHIVAAVVAVHIGQVAEEVGHIELAAAVEDVARIVAVAHRLAAEVAHIGQVAGTALVVGLVEHIGLVVARIAVVEVAVAARTSLAVGLEVAVDRTLVAAHIAPVVADPGPRIVVGPVAVGPVVVDSTFVLDTCWIEFVGPML